MYAVYIFNGFSCFWMSITLAFGITLVIGDSLVLLTISLLRFYSIAFPLKCINYKLVTTLVILQSLLSMVIGGKVFHIYLTGHTSADFEVVIYIAGPVVFMINTLTILCISFSFLVIKKKRKLNGNTNVPTIDRIRIQQQKKSAVTLLMMVSLLMFLMFIQITGYTILIVKVKLDLVKLEEYIYLLRFIDIAVLCSMLNPGLNCTIYICRCKKLKRLYWSILKILKCKKRD